MLGRELLEFWTTESELHRKKVKKRLVESWHELERLVVEELLY